MYQTRMLVACLWAATLTIVGDAARCSNRRPPRPARVDDRRVDRRNAKLLRDALRQMERRRTLHRPPLPRHRRRGAETGRLACIGWDPRKQQLKSWSFDTQGGFGDGYWLVRQKLDRRFHRNHRRRRRSQNLGHLHAREPRQIHLGSEDREARQGRPARHSRRVLQPR